MPFCVALSLVMKHGSTSMRWRANFRVWNGKTQCTLSKKVQISTHMGKGMLIVFWDSQGPVLEHY